MEGWLTQVVPCELVLGLPKFGEYKFSYRVYCIFKTFDIDIFLNTMFPGFISSRFERLANKTRNWKKIQRPHKVLYQTTTE